MEETTLQFQPEDFSSIFEGIGKECYKPLLEIFIAARDLITSPQNWTQGCMARSSTGGARNVVADDADRFCAQGAMVRTVFERVHPNIIPSALSPADLTARLGISGRKDSRDAEQILDRAAQIYSLNRGILKRYRGVTELNDRRHKTSHANVMAVYGIVITMLESKERESHELNDQPV